MFSAMPGDIARFLGQLRERRLSAVVFGSRAAGCAEQSSDWDILVLGTGDRHCDGRFDVVYVPLERVPFWLGSELATHVLAYGQWVEEDPWLSVDQVDFVQASSRKRDVLRRHISAADHAWPWLGRVRQRRVARRIEYDIWRLCLLDEHLPVCATARLPAISAARRGAAVVRDYLRDLGVSRSRVGDLLGAIGMADCECLVSQLPAAAIHLTSV